MPESVELALSIVIPVTWMVVSIVRIIADECKYENNKDIRDRIVSDIIESRRNKCS